MSNIPAVELVTKDGDNIQKCDVELGTYAAIENDDISNEVLSASPPAAATTEASADINISEIKDRIYFDQLQLTLLVFMLIDFLCFIKYILFPVLLIRLMGGPFLITIPWTLWAFANYAFQASFSIPSIDADNNGATGLFQVMRYKFCNFVPSDDSFMLRFSEYSLIGQCVWNSVDISFSIITLVICLVASLIIFVEPDGFETPGWKKEHQLAITEIIFCALSIVSRLAIIILLALIRCKQNDSACAPSTSPRFKYSLTMSCTINTIRTYSFFVCSFFSLLSLAFAIAAIHIFLRANFYITSDIENKYQSCDPLVPSVCSLPFPSSYYLVNDSSTVTGYRIDMSETALPYTKNDKFMSSSLINYYDGFSVSGALLFHIENVQENQLTSFQNIDKSLLINSTTLLVDLDNVELHPHFAEVDYLNPDPTTRLQYIQPAKSMRFNTHYCAVVQGLTRASDDNALPRSDTMSCYVKKYLNMSYSYDICGSLDGDNRYRRFATKVFPVLQSLNVSIDSVQLVWDFHTASQDSMHKKLTSPRSSTIAAISNIQSNLKYKMTLETHQSCSGYRSGSQTMGATIYYRMDVPWYLENDKRFANFIDWDQDWNKTASFGGDVGILIQVPCSVVLGDVEPSILLEFGHGIFGTRGNAITPWLLEEANTNGWLLWSMDWRGFSSADLPVAARLMMLDSGATVKSLEAAVIQGFHSKLYGQEAVRKILSDERNTLQLPSNFDFYNKTLLPAKFIGESMGGILGAGYTAFSKYDRSVLLVSGSPFSFILSRSDMFLFFVKLMDLQFYNRADIRIVLTTWQLFLDTAESTSWANTGQYQASSNLLQVGLGDTTVTTIASRILAANLNATQLQPEFFSIYGVGLSTAPITKTKGINVIQQGKYPGDARQVPKDSHIPTNPTQVHSCFPNERGIMSQFSTFLTYDRFEACQECTFASHASC